MQTRKLGMRAEDAVTEQVEIAEFAPAALPFLGLAAYLQLELYEAATRAVSGAPDLKSKDVLARVAGETLSKHQRFTAEIRRRGLEPHVVMEPFSETIDNYVSIIETDDWHQHVLAIYLVGGLFDDFFSSLASGMKDQYSDEAIAILGEEGGRLAVKQLLEDALREDEKLGSWLALWGRRLVGDTLLMTRVVLLLSDHRPFVANEVSPILDELIADHIRRMDGLGLTA